MKGLCKGILGQNDPNHCTRPRKECPPKNDHIEGKWTIFQSSNHWLSGDMYVSFRVYMGVSKIGVPKMDGL